MNERALLDALLTDHKDIRQAARGGGEWPTHKNRRRKARQARRRKNRRTQDERTAA